MTLYSLILTSPHKDDFYTIIEINSNQLLCSEANGNHLYICTYTHNSYKYIKLPKYHKSSHLFLIGKDKNIYQLLYIILTKSLPCDSEKQNQF